MVLLWSLETCILNAGKTPRLLDMIGISMAKANWRASNVDVLGIVSMLYRLARGRLFKHILTTSFVRVSSFERFQLLYTLSSESIHSSRCRAS
jgi:hypothetical protein